MSEWIKIRTGNRRQINSAAKIAGYSVKWVGQDSDGYDVAHLLDDSSNYNFNTLASLTSRIQIVDCSWQ